MKPVATIRQHFNDFAPRYDNRLTAFVGERELRQIRPLVPAGSLVLDYGCGTGRTTLDLLRRGCTVTAYDISTGMLDQAITKSARLNLTAEFISDPAQLSGREWPVITCIGVLDYYPEPGPLLELLKGYMAPGGLLVVTYPNAYSPWGWLYAAASRLTYPATPRTPQFAHQAARRAGFEVVALRHAYPALAPIGYTLVLCLRAASGGA